MDYNAHQQSTFPTDMSFTYAPQIIVPNPYSNPWTMPYGNNYMPQLPVSSELHTNLFNEVSTPKLADHQRNRDRQAFAEVSGRLCLLSNSKKYTVTVGEICRRICSPETLNISLINAILRSGKSKENGKKLQANLKNFDVTLLEKRRKTCTTTCFTALCEGESTEMATDLGSIIATYGGAIEIGRYLRETEVQQEGDFFGETSIVVRKWLLKIVELHPRTENCDEILPKNRADVAVQHLSLLTHGYSHIAIPTILRFVMEIMENVNLPRNEETKWMLHDVSDENKPLTLQNQDHSMMMRWKMPPHLGQSHYAPFADGTNQALAYAPGEFSYPFFMGQQQQIGFDGGHYVPPFGHGVATLTSPFTENTYPPSKLSLQERLMEFGQVSGRLLLLSESHKYVVTVGEITRRMDDPETLNTCTINGNLRNGKGKDNGTALRSRLQNYNIQLPQGRRKTCKSTKYTCLCEEEARKLAKDFETLLKKDGGANEIGAYLGEKEAAEGNRELVREGQIVRSWLQTVIQVHMNGAKPEFLQPMNNAERAVERLSLITHGFGHIAIPAVLSYVSNIIEEAIAANRGISNIQPMVAPIMPPIPPLFSL